MENWMKEALRHDIGLRPTSTAYYKTNDRLYSECYSNKEKLKCVIEYADTGVLDIEMETFSISNKEPQKPKYAMKAKISYL